MMAGTSSAPAPSIAADDPFMDTVEFFGSPVWRRYKLEGCVVITTLLFSSMLILRSLRHRTGWSFTKFCLRAGAFLSMHALSYVFGLLDDTPLFEGLVLVWAVFLIVLATTTYNSGSESLDDNEASRKRFLWDKVVLSFWFVLLLLLNLSGRQFFTALVVLWILNLFKLRERKLALISACRSRFGLDRVTMVVAEFMKKETLPSTPLSTPNPTTMKGYDYLVGVYDALDQVFSPGPPEHDKPLDLDKVATLESIWQSEGSLLSEEGDPEGHLKDTCLSFALLWLLLRRYADYELYELSTKESREKSWNFVRYGLIKEQDDGEECERAFRVVEGELEFLYDYFYNNYFAIYSKGVRFLLIRVVVLSLYLVVAFVTLWQLHRIGKSIDPSYDKHDTQIKVTQWIIVIISVVEFIHIVDLITSKWNKVKLACHYVKGSWWETRWGRFKEGYLRILCQSPCFNPFVVSSWQNKLHQYSLLDSYGYNPMVLRFRRILEGYFDLPLIGQKESKPMKLSKEVKKAVIQCLQTNGPRLSNGVASLLRNKEERLSWACKSSDRTTHVILIWHIATSMCEIDSNPSPNLVDAANFVDNFRVATSLSKYCAYLVVMAPKLLPDHVYVTQWVFEQVVREARKTFKHCHSKKSKYEKLMSLSEESEQASTLEQGAALGKQLCGMKDASLRWKVLADFWAEMILYLAPSEDAASHAQYLVTGGEFITHLWALLTHAGIVDRNGGGEHKSI